eukprot:1749634-Pleurochrysis_carterae.AAC.1
MLSSSAAKCLVQECLFRIQSLSLAPRVSRKNRTRALRTAATVHVGPNAGVLCVLSLVFVWAFVPETKGKSLEEIQQMLK